MKTYLQAYDLWLGGYEYWHWAHTIEGNFIVAQIKHHSGKQAKRYKAMSNILYEFFLSAWKISDKNE